MVRAFCFLTVTIVGDMFPSKWLGFLGGLEGRTGPVGFRGSEIYF